MRRTLQTFCLSALGLALAGCSSLEDRAAANVEAARAGNVYSAVASLPVDLKRVAVLPLVSDDARGDMIIGCETLGLDLSVELARTRKFETVTVSPESLRACSGRTGWTGMELLPPDFFAVLRERSGCDAVLFSQLTGFRPYPPMTVGWRLKLVDCRTQQVIWSADEVFDANAAPERRKGFHPFPQQKQPGEVWVMQNSPQRFGQYTMARLLATLPDR